MKKIVVIPVGFLLLSLAVCAGGLIYQARQKNSVAPIVLKSGPDKLTDKSTGKLVPGQTAPPSSMKAAEPRIVTMIAVGDIMLSRNVAAKIKKYNDFNYPFASTSAYLRSVDFVFGNLESPITPGPVVPTGSFTFHADPGAETALAAANFKVLSLANNHLPNYGAAGIADTIKKLDAAGIKHAGAGRNLAEAALPARLEVGGIKFAFLAYNDSDVLPAGYGATPTRTGTALMDIISMQAAVSAAKKQADLVIVSMHSGAEYTEELTKSQTAFAHAAVDAGAELVLGHHPHVTQRVEKYKDKYIFYSLGNFVFDQMWSEETRRGLAIKLFFSRAGLLRAEVKPVLVMDYARPVLADKKTAEAIYQRLRLGSVDRQVLPLSVD